jgi:dihydrofolate synthase/folylpolyglutamate synthase
MLYSEAIRYLEGFINYEDCSVYSYKASFRLERFRDFLRLIGNPQDSFKSIHVAGSKGKGSTCAFLTYILREAGHRVGLYTSPHLADFRERIRILGPKPEGRQPDDFEGMIPRAELAYLVSRLKQAIEIYSMNSPYGPLTYFEACTALAFQYFKDKNTDLAVLETGLGGRLDATNVVTPLVTVITPISYEHTQKLGKTLAKIAGEKAGIIKHRIPLVCAPQEKAALGVIRNRCKENNSRLFLVNRVPKQIRGVNLGLVGGHQKINAAVSYKTAELLRKSGFKIDNTAIKKGLSRVRWPGRCEVVSNNPLVILDGAQNSASARVLREAIKENFDYKRLILVLGISSDKDIRGICREFDDFADTIIVTRANTPRACSVNKLASNFGRRLVYKTVSVKRAIALAKGLSRKGDLILVTGSLFVVGEARC